MRARGPEDNGERPAPAAEPSIRAVCARRSEYQSVYLGWAAFTAFLDDGRICLTNNAAERALRGIVPGRKSWLFAGSERGGDRAAFMYTLIVTAKMNDIDPQAWMADLLARLPNITVSRLHELLPSHWKAEVEAIKAA